MDKTQAGLFITNLVTQPFDRTGYQLFLRNLLNRYEPCDRHYMGNSIADAFG